MQTSETTTLEPIADHHANSAFELIDNNRDYLRVWLPWVDNMQAVENFQNFIQGAKQRLSAGMEVSFMILNKGKVAGRIGLYYIDQQNKIASIGYWLGEEYQGKGIVTKACKEVIKHGFTELGLNRIEIKCATGNTRSQAIPERLGFTKEGILRQAELVNGQFHDLYLYSLLKQEWEKDLKHS